ncbi:MAG: acyltransferase family protein [Spirochaetaceae bacterium]|nr:acyltransferase family protein [Spirochaetaceae bacterium]
MDRPVGKKRPRFLLILSLIIQLSWLGFNYFATAVRGGIFSFPFSINTLPDVLFPRFFFFYVFGIWMGAFPDRIKSFIKDRTLILLIISLMSALLLITEHGVLYYMISSPVNEIELWRIFKAMSEWKITTAISSLSFILLLFRLGQINMLNWKWLKILGGSTYIIYILNGPCLQPIIKLLNHWTINPVFHGLIFIFLTISGIFLPLIIINITKRRLPKVRLIIGYN